MVFTSKNLIYVQLPTIISMIINYMEFTQDLLNVKYDLTGGNHYLVQHILKVNIEIE